MDGRGHMYALVDDTGPGPKHSAAMYAALVLSGAGYGTTYVQSESRRRESEDEVGRGVVPTAVEHWKEWYDELVLPLAERLIDSLLVVY